MTDIPQRAVVYCRVSDTKQTIRGHGLGSQETRCRQHADAHHYDVVEVFRDDFTGASTERPGMKAMLAYLKKSKIAHVVIIDDISRLARDVVAHTQLRRAIRAVGGFLVSPSIEFKEDSDGRFVENVLASSAQHMREKNAEQTLNRMRARVTNGYWVFQAPVGYRYERVKGEGQVLVRHEPLASIVAEALEGYASGRFQSQAELMRWLQAKPEYPKDKSDRLRNQRVTDLLVRSLYAGYIDVPRWGIALVPGKHPPLISFDTYRKIQARMKEGARVPARADLNEDFPLRGFIACADCGDNLTACHSKGRSRSYAYYLCFNRSCDSYKLSIPKARIEGEFESLLGDMRPSAPLFEMAAMALKDWWDHRLKSGKDRAKVLQAELQKVERSVAQFLDRVVEADSPVLVTAYENRIRALEQEKVALRENIANCGRPLRSFDVTFRTAMQFLANPCNLWTSGRIENQRAVLKLAFAERLQYSRIDGFRTAVTSSPFRLLSGFEGGEMAMARPTGFEPVA